MIKSSHSILPAAILLVLSIIIALIASLRVPEKTTELAVIFPFSNSFFENAQIIARSGIPIIREGLGNSIFVVENSLPETKSLLYNNGALLVFNPIILGNCFPKTKL
jgi:hypothetical protein